MGKTNRVIVCGSRNVGKTTILEQLVNGNITKATEMTPTIEDIYVASVETERGTRETLRFHDTAGLDGGSASVGQSQLGRHLLALADGYVLVYDSAQPATLELLATLKKDIDRSRDKKEVVAIVLDNSSRSRRAATGPSPEGSVAERGAAWATREKMRHFEVNAFDRASLLDALVHLSSRLNPPPQKSSFPQLSLVRKSIGRPET